MNIVKAKISQFRIVQRLMKNLYLKQVVCYWNNSGDIKEKLVKGQFYLVKENAKYVGIFSINILSDDLILSSIAIDPKYRKYGYGRSIINYLFIYAQKRHLKGILLATMRLYGVWKFYEKHGFKRINKNKYCGRVYYEYYKKIK